MMELNTVRYGCLLVLTLQVGESNYLVWLPRMFPSCNLMNVYLFQTTVSVLAMRYSRKKIKGGKELYIGTTLVLVAEILKLFFCLVLLLVQKSGSLKQTFKVISNEVFFKPRETVKLVIPSSLYSLQNNLVLLALSSLDAATFQVNFMKSPFFFHILGQTRGIFLI